jgi:AcrR family transcriptional regulator
MEREDTRARIVEAAAVLLTEGGRDAVSTRAVCAAAGVQAPTIYRIFGDKQGLLDAVAGHGFATYLRDKADQEVTDDPVDDLRRGWDLHIGFGLAQPAFYTLIYGDIRPGVEPPAARRAAEVLAVKVQRIAAAGRLRVSEERAAHLVHAAGCGMTLTLIALPPERRDLTLSTVARESILATVTTDGPPPQRADDELIGRAVALRTVVRGAAALTPAEQCLLTEWLDRISTGAAPG